MTKLKCWEVSECGKEDCPAHRSHDLNCWLLSGNCSNRGIRFENSGKPDVCLSCEVFKENVDLPSARKTFKAMDAQIALYKEAAESSEKELQSMSIELAIGLSEVFEALKMIASGNRE